MAGIEVSYNDNNYSILVTVPPSWTGLDEDITFDLEPDEIVDLIDKLGEALFDYNSARHVRRGEMV